MGFFEKHTQGTGKHPSANISRSSGKLTLILINTILILFAICSSFGYSHIVKADNEQLQLDAFCSTIESMKQASATYLNTEKGYVDDWASYIMHEHMSVDEALDYIRKANTQSDRYAHIIDMDTFDAWSTYAKNGDNSVSCYANYKNQSDSNYTSRIFTQNVYQVFNSTEGELNVIGKYRISETQQTVISVGTRVMLRTDDGRSKVYLLLRIIPVESLRSTWVFPTDYTAAEVSVISREGEYVIQSESMKSRNFPEYIRGYNFQDDYNKVDALIDELASNENGLLVYKNYKGEDCYWYYSSFGSASGLDILGYIPVHALNTVHMNWLIVFIISGTMLLLLVIDISYIMQTNRQLQQAADMAEQANQAKTRFLSAMSHDIRTPMNAVLGMTDIAKKNIDDPEYVMHCLDNISRAGSHLLTLINDILDISKVESGKMQLNPNTFSLESAITDLDNIIRPRADEKHLHFEVSLHDISAPYLFADELRLNQIAINLLTNAVKYTNPGGDIHFEVWQEPLPPDSGMVRICTVIADTGIGMTEEFQKTMYSSFTRAADSRIDKVEGSGLGLSITKQLVDLMHGQIQCDSSPGKGTTYRVTLDLTIADDNAVQIFTSHTADSFGSNTAELSKLHLLIAEDNDLNWEIIQTQLAEYGIRSDRAENGQECIDKLTSAPPHTYDLILMDIQMPVLNGKEAARRIRACEDSAISSIPIIAITADAFAEDIKDCMDAGMNGHIAKPVDMKKVLQLLYSICRFSS